MSDNPFLDTLNKRQELAPSQNYAENLNTLNTENPFLDTLKKREEDRQNQIKADLKRTLTSVLEKDPDMVGEGLKLAEELNLPKTKVIVDSTESKIDFSVSKIGGLNNIEKKVFYGRIANENDRLNYKFRHFGFLELGDLFINDLPIQQKKFNNVNHVVLKFSDFNKYNLKNIINCLPFTLKVYKFPDSKPQQFIFNYDKSVDYYPYLICYILFVQSCQ